MLTEKEKRIKEVTKQLGDVEFWMMLQAIRAAEVWFPEDPRMDDLRTQIKLRQDLYAEWHMLNSELTSQPSCHGSAVIH